MRKRYTHRHFIELLGFNHVEKQALLAGCTWQRYVSNTNYNGFLQTYAEDGKIEGGRINVQLKSTDKINRAKKTGEILFNLSIKDLEAWLNRFTMVLLVLYDAKNDMAYFVELDSYFQTHREALRKVNKFVRVHIPVANVFTPEAVKHLRTIKNS